MALARCNSHGNPVGKSQPYVQSCDPIGYPKGAIICGRPGCSNQARIWLTKQEAGEYGTGQRIFEIRHNAVKVQVASDQLTEGR